MQPRRSAQQLRFCFEVAGLPCVDPAQPHGVLRDLPIANTIEVPAVPWRMPGELPAARSEIARRMLSLRLS